MMRTCPQCLDFYADELLLFCLSDGTPLVGVDPQSEQWSEGQRVIEEKDNVLGRQKRRLKWRRIVLTSMTMLIVAAVVFVVTVNGFIYLKPQAEKESARTDPSTSPATSNSPDVSVIPATTGETAPASWPVVDPRPTPSPNAATVTRPTPTPTPRPALPAAPESSPTPFITSALPSCSDEDKGQEREAIIRSFRDTWRRNIEGDRQRIIAENAPERSQGTEATLGALEYTSSFFKACSAGVVTVSYVWRVRTSVNGTIKVLSIPKEKKFACMKIGGTWLCR
jgi:hypothetical protein